MWVVCMNVLCHVAAYTE